MKVIKIRISSKNIKSLISFILLLHLFLTEIYYIFIEISWLSYSSFLYRGFSMFLGLFWILIYFLDILKKRKINLIEAISFLFLGALVFLSYYTFVNNNFNVIATVTFQKFLIRSIPAFLAGFYVFKNNIFFLSFKWLDILVIYLNIGITITLFKNLSRGLFGRNMIFGGIHYQAFSYISALSFGLTLFLIFFNDINFKIFKNKLYNSTRYIFLLLSFIGVIYGTGRGAFILTLVFIFFAFIFKMKTFYKIIKNKRKIINFLFFSIPIFIIVIYAINYIFDIPQISRGLEKQISFLIKNGEVGLNWNETSGRLNIYKYSWSIFKQKPFFGHGINSIYYLGLTGAYSHNIFLDLLVDGGIIYFSFFNFLLLYIIIKIYFLFKKNSLNFALFILFFNSYIMLLVSGSYLRETGLWFVMAYAILNSMNNKTNL